MLFQLAAKLLQEETDKWEEENNSIVKVAKEMAQQMMQMAKFARRRNRVQVRARDVILSTHLSARQLRTFSSRCHIWFAFKRRGGVKS